MTASDIVVFGLSHVDISVRDLRRAQAIYGATLGFTAKASGDGWVDLDSGGTIAIRLLEVTRVERRAAVRIMTTVEATLDALVRVGCRRAYSPFRTPTNELVAVAHDPDDNVITVWRALTEDEYEVVPHLPTTMTWAPDAEALLKSLLKAVPALFRGLARRRVAAMAEELTGARNLVTREDVIRGYILASPKVTRGRNRQPLIDHGIDVDAYQADWESE